jgi:hypothetical protein
MYPKDYAQMLNETEELPDTAKPRRNDKLFLKGKNIFYTGGDMTWASEKTMGRMDLVSFFVRPTQLFHSLNSDW